MKKTWQKVLTVSVALVVLFVAVASIWLYSYSVEQNKTIITAQYMVSHPQIPAAFEGQRIVHLADLHNVDFGAQLTELVKQQNPDVIAVTGDWISNDDEDIAPAKRQIEELVEIAPVFYVAGNHEAWAPLCADLLIYMEEVGVTVLESRAVDWIIGDDSVQLIGMFDTEFSTHMYRDFAPNVDPERYSILLYHRPEYLEEAVGFGADLMLSGHTHGGQIRLPYIGALYAPNQGWFPKYDVGRFTYDDATMIVTQGLGVKTAVRILTPPEISVITLDSPLIS